MASSAAPFLRRICSARDWPWLTAAAFALFTCAWAPQTAAAADPAKVLRVSFSAAETGFDPARVHDIYSVAILEAIFEPLYTYDYLARPLALAPLTAESMPEVQEDGRLWTIRLKKGIQFSPDAVFKGKPRELTAQDYAYSLKRMMDPKLHSPHQWALEGLVVGLDELAEEAKKTNKFDYDRPIEGITTPDRYTLRIRLKQPDYNFGLYLALPQFGAVAREVIEGYEDTNAHPVGTGAYLLKEWRRASKIVLAANPVYRQEFWNFKAGDDADDKIAVSQNLGKAVPQIGEVEISIIEEGQARWLAFQQGGLDLLEVPPEFANVALAGDRLAPAFAGKGIRLQRDVNPDLTYTTFNFRDPVIGGFSREKIALRRALLMAYNTAEEIAVIRQGQGVAATMPIPPNVIGFSEQYRRVNIYNPKAANELLDRFGYKRGSDGLRTLPDGKPLTLVFSSGTTGLDRQLDELWQKSLVAIGIRTQFNKGKFSDHLREAKVCKLMIWSLANNAAFPEGDDFMQMLNGAAVGQNNYSCYKSEVYDKFYAQAKRLPNGPERAALYRKMTKQIEVDAAIHLGVHRLVNQMNQPWVLGYRRHPILRAPWKYLDIDLQRQAQSGGMQRVALGK